ncbi:terpene cyclase [Streptomyces sp. NPDC057740]|uniref:terpene synthase family protein n=1 Tax=Streptomyces sp. NPDC057740 TaxID=3346234 RepID=UPI0036A4B6C7
MPAPHVPVFYMPYPVEPPNPFLEEARQRLQDWLVHHQLVTTREAWAQVERTRPDLMAARYYPKADRDALVRHMQWLAWGFVVDDEFDDGPAGRDPQQCQAVIRELSDAVAGGPVREPYARALVDLWQATVRDRSREWKRVHLHDFCTVLWTYHTETIGRVTGTQFTSLAEYIPFRCQSVAILFYGADHAEAALGIDLPDFVRHLPALAAIRRLVCEHIGLLNDIFSVAKDRALNNSNAVDIVMAKRDCDQAAALDHLNALLTRKINDIAAHEAVLAGQLIAAGADGPTQEQVAACVAAYKALTRGNHDWHFEVGRYTAPEAIHNGIPLYTQDLFARPPVSDR